ncbi:MAG: DUF4435 domain-containing protein [Prevotella sp.]|nr:DUF4435 domain-containing protein [Prevotella sp.]
MADVYQEQARFFANVPLMQSGVVASVHLEDVDDKMFWNVMLQSQHPGKYYYITQSRSPKGFDTKGCEQCLKYRPYLSKHFFVCIDSDMRYLMKEPDLGAGDYICQTYTYSWENHYCEASSLQRRFEKVCPEKVATFDFQQFMAALSEVLYKPLLLLLFCLKNDKPDFSMRMFSACLPNQCKRAELTDNGKLLIERIAKNFELHLNSPFAQSVDLEDEKAYCQALGVNEQNAYLHVRGHNLFDLVSYIGDLLCRGTSISFRNDVLLYDMPSQSYWEIKKVASDITEIVTQEEKMVTKPSIL